MLYTDSTNMQESRLRDLGPHRIFITGMDFPILDFSMPPQNDTFLITPKIKYEEVNKLQDEFHLLAKKWRKDTQYFSSAAKMAQHPAYRRIMDMGKAVLPYLLNELNQNPDHWLVALNTITGENPAPENSTFDEAVQAWLAWGRKEGYLQ